MSAALPAAPAPAVTIASPCTGVCRMDARSGWCEGCLRTLDEIAGWSTMADDEKRAVRSALELRRLQPGAANPP